MTFPPLEPSPMLADPGPVPPISHPNEISAPDEDAPVPDPDDPLANQGQVRIIHTHDHRFRP